MPAPPLDESRGTPQPFSLAYIDEATCIGCTLCLQVCPTDAIVGAAKQMHTVLGDRCTGCELCLPPCPVDCIAMLPASQPWSAGDSDRARVRYAARNARLARRAAKDKDSSQAEATAEVRRAAIAAAFARARARRASA